MIIKETSLEADASSFLLWKYSEWFDFLNDPSEDIYSIEMKRFLIETMHIPEKEIIKDHHARHTSTNMRNCARLIFRYGIPMDKPCISSSNKEQSHYISGKGMENRCIEEQGYSAYKNGNRISKTEDELFLR